MSSFQKGANIEAKQHLFQCNKLLTALTKRACWNPRYRLLFLSHLPLPSISAVHDFPKRGITQSCIFQLKENIPAGYWDETEQNFHLTATHFLYLTSNTLKSAHINFIPTNELECKNTVSQTKLYQSLYRHILKINVYIHTHAPPLDLDQLLLTTIKIYYIKIGGKVQAARLTVLWDRKVRSRIFNKDGR